MKKLLVSFGVLSVGAATLIASSAFAAVTTTNYSMTPNPVEVGTEVTVEVTATKDSNGCNNNWGYTKVTVDGNSYQSSLNSFTGTGEVSDSVAFNAPATAGDFPVLVEVYSGVEVGAGSEGADCPDVLIDSEELTLTVTDSTTEPSMTVVSLTPVDQTRTPSGNITYTAAVEVAGNPTVGQLQCVVFDKYPLADGWEEVSVTAPTEAGTINVEHTFDLDGHDLGVFTVKAIAFDVPCDDSAVSGENLDTAAFNTEGLFATTSLTIQTEPCEGILCGEVDPEGELAVTEVEAIDVSATANDSYESGWSFVFHITLPTDETSVAMKFGQWTGAGSFPSGGNMRISSAQADNGGATIPVVANDTYTTPDLNMVTDLDGGTPGVQVEVLVEIKIPVGSPSGSYSTSYGVQSN